jgi:hypothetical protein
MNNTQQKHNFKSFIVSLNEVETPRPKSEKRFRNLHTDNINVIKDPSSSISFDYDNNEIDLNDVNFDSVLWNNLDHTGGDEEDEEDYFYNVNDDANGL